MAAAVFSPEDQKVYVVEDTKDTTGYDLIALSELQWAGCLLAVQHLRIADRAVVEQTQPKTIIMSARVQDELFARVKEYCKSHRPSCAIRVEVKTTVRASSLGRRYIGRRRQDLSPSTCFLLRPPNLVRSVSGPTSRHGSRVWSS